MIAVRKTFKKSCKEIWNHPLNWIRVVFLPFVICALGFAFMVAVFLSTGQHQFIFLGGVLEQTVPATSPFGIFAQFVYYVTCFVAVTGLYVKGFRYAALKKGGDKWWEFPFDIRLIKMFLYYLLITFLIALYVGISTGITVSLLLFLESTFVTVLLSVGFSILGVYLITRLVLTFLYVAIDKEKALRTSWRVMKGNVWRFLLLVVLISLAVLGLIIAGSIVIGVFGWILGFIVGWLGIVIFALFVPFVILMMLVSMAWTITAIAHVNKQIMEKK